MQDKQVENAPITFGTNLGYILDLHDMYIKDPSSVSEEMQLLFSEIGSTGSGTVLTQDADQNKVKGLIRLVDNIRLYGHLQADIYPLFKPKFEDLPSIIIEEYGLTPEDLKKFDAGLVSQHLKDRYSNAYEAITELTKLYTGPIAYEYMHITDLKERDWIKKEIETAEENPLSDDEKLELFTMLAKVEGFEKYLHKNFVGAKRFSIEGVDVIVPMLEHLLRLMADEGIPHMQIGMAHRGRLNVLTHILNKPYTMMLSEFMHQDPLKVLPEDGSFAVTQGWHKDVKYHLGAKKTRDDNKIEQTVTLANNPSHLEVVGPVVLGKTRAQQETTNSAGPASYDHNKALAVLIHGDSAMPGQGVVYETLNLSRLEGYKVGGSIHIVANNRIGFTTDEEDSRSTVYSSSNASGFDVPVLHVNADNPEAAIQTLRFALKYRQKFNKDIIIDVIGYRRHGHNEMDEPTPTNPLLYQEVKKHDTIEELYGKQLVENETITQDQFDQTLQSVNDELRAAQDSIDKDEMVEDTDMLAPEEILAGHDNDVEEMSFERLNEVNEAMLETPSDFNMFKKLKNVLEKRREPFTDKEKRVDWAHAEALAFATINQDGTPIRLSGQDTERGTFAHRHAVLHDVETGEKHYPLHNTPNSNASFNIYNSPLTEAAVVGYEYGYNIENNDAMVIWEAQFGDFANMAQVYFDNFVFSSRSKWGEASGITFLLPHAQEGQGPEHSSARLERFLDLAAESNMTVANLTSTSNYFYLLRRQAKYLGTDKMRPLVIMSPKSLLRNQRVAQPVDAFVDGSFKEIIVDEYDKSKISTVLLSSGKMAVDLMDAMDKNKDETKLLIRLEQLYPFPDEQIKEILDELPSLKSIRFVQEEPENMGAYQYALPLIQELAPSDVDVEYVGRIKRASPAEGSNEAYKAIQQKIIDNALE